VLLRLTVVALHPSQLLGPFEEPVLEVGFLARFVGLDDALPRSPALFAYARSASLARVCHPRPTARKASTTSRSTRRLMLQEYEPIVGGEGDDEASRTNHQAPGTGAMCCCLRCLWRGIHGSAQGTRKSQGRSSEPPRTVRPTQMPEGGASPGLIRKSQCSKVCPWVRTSSGTD